MYVLKYDISYMDAWVTWDGVTRYATPHIERAAMWDTEESAKEAKSLFMLYDPYDVSERLEIVKLSCKSH